MAGKKEDTKESQARQQQFWAERTDWTERCRGGRSNSSKYGIVYYITSNLIQKLFGIR
jgi:hypothetical protein